MSITYEQALGTLTSMFSSPWTEESLDTVLRHFEGHMENTVDAVLTHGDLDPQLLIKRLESGANQEDLDAQLARELANGTQPFSSPNPSMSSTATTRSNRLSSASSISSNSSTSTPTTSNNRHVAPAYKKGRGTPTTLPDDFLRIPGNAHISSDEALARMLQDKLFAEEIKRNPEFAHLAQGGPGGQNRSYPGWGRSNHQQQNEGPNIMEALGNLGENAKKRLQELAVKVKSNIDNIDSANKMRNMGPYGGGNAERRGLLDIGEDDDEEQEISFATPQTRPDYEMRDFDKKRD